jgi:NAD(P)-dependent dehydrogenase (short-subunit alcohol dehydrogenase family)
LGERSFTRQKDWKMQARGLKVKVVVVTGGGQGIGPGTALRMAAEGGLVMVADLKEKRDQDLVQAIAAAAGQG